MFVYNLIFLLTFNLRIGVVCFGHLLLLNFLPLCIREYNGDIVLISVIIFLYFHTDKSEICKHNNDLAVVHYIQRKRTVQ